MHPPKQTAGCNSSSVVSEGGIFSEPVPCDALTLYCIVIYLHWSGVIHLCSCFVYVIRWQLTTHSEIISILRFQIDLDFFSLFGSVIIFLLIFFCSTATLVIVRMTPMWVEATWLPAWTRVWLESVLERNVPSPSHHISAMERRAQVCV